MANRDGRWAGSPERTRLLALYAEVDALLGGSSCACSEAGVGATPQAQCCHFAVTGREPYPTAVELEEVRYAVRASPLPRSEVRRMPADGPKGMRSEVRRMPGTPEGSGLERTARRSLPMAELRPCPLLSHDGRCRIYASRPFGCRTFFCGQRPARDAVSAIGRRIADLSARFDPRDPGPRPLVRALGIGPQARRERTGTMSGRR
jgi:Fe-S-cluster containining protein